MRRGSVTQRELDVAGKWGIMRMSVCSWGGWRIGKSQDVGWVANSDYSVMIVSRCPEMITIHSLASNSRVHDYVPLL